ncbi:MAG: response regulator [Methanomicrobiales archaeon HGW-Methanomicrobiales-5]|jgi:CheY-like chemotaxis protein|nr:MAG: response regulator [Methanomicrobiales archaeon HGW-Methanomicrobiales-5]
MTSKGRILLMDDEQIILDVTQEVLKFLDYEVMFTRDGEAAIELYKQEKSAGNPFDVVILDLSVPDGMGGKETIGLLKTFDPDVKAIVSTGFSNDPAVLNFASYGFSGKLTKPYKINDLKTVLEKLIPK